MSAKCVWGNIAKFGPRSKICCQYAVLIGTVMKTLHRKLKTVWCNMLPTFRAPKCRHRGSSRRTRLLNEHGRVTRGKEKSSVMRMKISPHGKSAT